MKEDFASNIGSCARHCNNSCKNRHYQGHLPLPQRGTGLACRCRPAAPSRQTMERAGLKASASFRTAANKTTPDNKDNAETAAVVRVVLEPLGLQQVRKHRLSRLPQYFREIAEGMVVAC